MDPIDAIAQARLAKNEALFRAINERIRDAANRFGDDDHAYEFLCECCNQDCIERISLTLSEYEHVREEGRRFLLAPGHDDRTVENVVAVAEDHLVVEKTGVAKRVAEALNPRAA